MRLRVEKRTRFLEGNLKELACQYEQAHSVPFLIWGQTIDHHIDSRHKLILECGCYPHEIVSLTSLVPSLLFFRLGCRAFYPFCQFVVLDFVLVASLVPPTTCGTGTRHQGFHLIGAGLDHPD